MLHLHTNIHDESLNIAPSPSPAASVWRTDGGYTDFDVEKQEVIVDDMHLRFTLNNTDGANTITLVPAELQVDRIEVLGNRSVKLYDWFGTQLFARANLHHNGDQRSARSVISNTNTSTFAGATAIAASGNVTYEIRIPGPWDVIDFSLNWMESLRIRVYWNGVDSKSAGSAAITSVDLDSAKLVIAEKAMPVMHAGLVHNMPNNSEGGLLIQYFDNQRMQLNPTYSNNQSGSHTLDSFTGKASEWMVVARTATAGAPLAAASDVFETLELRDANNRQLKSQPTNVRHLRESVVPKHYPSDFCRVTNYNVFSPVPSGQMAVELSNGAMIGYEKFDRNILQFKTNGAIAGTYVVDFYLTQYTLINVSPSGRVVVKPSN